MKTEVQYNISKYCIAMQAQINKRIFQKEDYLKLQSSIVESTTAILVTQT